ARSAPASLPHASHDVAPVLAAVPAVPAPIVAPAPASLPRTAPQRAPKQPTAPATAAASTAAEPSPPALSGKLRLTADPPAGVSIQGPSGLRAFTTPVREVALPAGVYVVTFRNDTYGMPVVTRVKLEANGERAVHVDFREVEPRVTVR
ncbi:MAG: hypothetical protein QM756_29095, partial [Polyangiaceae bacterium]